MSTYTHSLRPVHDKRLPLAEHAEPREAPEDDGLGCMRGLAVAMFCNVILVLMIAAVWGLWRLLR